jgi:hypothetical protein
MAVDRRQLATISAQWADFPVTILVHRLKQFGWEPPADLIRKIDARVCVRVEDVPDDTLEAIVKDNIKSANPARAARLEKVLS